MKYIKYFIYCCLLCMCFYSTACLSEEASNGEKSNNCNIEHLITKPTKCLQIRGTLSYTDILGEKTGETSSLRQDSATTFWDVGLGFYNVPINVPILGKNTKLTFDMYAEYGKSYEIDRVSTTNPMIREDTLKRYIGIQFQRPLFD